MASSFRLVLGGTDADDDLIAEMGTLEVEENADLPGAFRMNLPVNRSDQSDLTYVSDPRFAPFANVAIVAMPEGGSPQCIFDGYVLSHRLHLETGTVSSTLEVTGQDGSWLMNLEEKTREWVDVTDGQVANTIFAEYGFTPANANTTDDGVAHTEDTHSLMQRGTDIQFLNGIARRVGKLCRVACTDTPGQYTGYFVSPVLDGDATVTLNLNPLEDHNIGALDLSWDVMRPTAIKARQALFNDSTPDGVSGDTDDTGLSPLGTQILADFAGRAMTSILSSTVDDGGELQLRAKAMLREAGWFVRCEGEANVGRLQAVLRVGTVVQLANIGALYSGKYYVWSVRHTITVNEHKMRFVLLRNALG